MGFIANKMCIKGENVCLCVYVCVCVKPCGTSF